MSEQAGLAHSVRDPAAQPRRRSKETRFEWKQALAPEYRKGIIDDPDVKFMERVGTFIWQGKPAPSSAPREGFVGIYFHGGGYCHFNASENSQTSKIPRRLIKVSYLRMDRAEMAQKQLTPLLNQSSKFSEIHAVEYRLLPKGPFPAALQDGLSVYAHLVLIDHVPPERIILIGDSAGGNLVLAMARWLRDLQLLPSPGGLLLLSPWCDPSTSYSCCLTHYTPRSNPDTDYLTDSPAPRRFMCRTFLASELGTNGSYTNFPPTYVLYSDAERLEDEIDMLVSGMRRDGVSVVTDKVPDAPHDVLMMMFWGEKTLQAIAARIAKWTETLWQETVGEQRSSHASAVVQSK